MSPFSADQASGAGLPHRGAASNPPNRFARLRFEADPDTFDPDEPPTATQFFADASESIITWNDSPDVGFEASINPYRGCEHGCISPGLNDHEIPRILDAAARAGARSAHYQILRLPLGVLELFDDWLKKHRPARRERVLAGLRDLRGGELTDARFHKRMTGEGRAADLIKQMFEVARQRAGLSAQFPELSTAAFRRPRGPQGELFD